MVAPGDDAEELAADFVEDGLGWGAGADADGVVGDFDDMDLCWAVGCTLGDGMDRVNVWAFGVVVRELEVVDDGFA